MFRLLIFRGIERNGRKTLTTVQGLPKKFDQKKILKVIKKKFGGLRKSSGSKKFHADLGSSSLQWHHRQRYGDGGGDSTPRGSAQGCSRVSGRQKRRVGA